MAIGSANRQFWLAHGAPESRVVPAPYSVDNTYFRQAADRVDRLSARRRFSIPGDATVALFAGKLVGKKDPQTIIRAAAALGGRVWLLVAGSGELEEQVRTLADSLQLKSITFAGFLNQSEMPYAYAASDFLVLSSTYRETWGLVVNEAMNFGLPAVVSDRVGCASDLIHEGRTGYVFRAGDHVALAERMSLMADGGRLRPMRAAARELIGGWGIPQTASGIERATEVAIRSR